MNTFMQFAADEKQLVTSFLAGMSRLSSAMTCYILKLLALVVSEKIKFSHL